MGLERLQLLVSDLRGPPFADIVEQGSTDGGHLVPARRHLQPFAALVLRVSSSRLHRQRDQAGHARSDTVTLNGIGHYAAMKAPDRLATALAAFFLEVDSNRQRDDASTTCAVAQADERQGGFPVI